jgi:thiosulfate reductase cytochrome b subunit
VPVLVVNPLTPEVGMINSNEKETKVSSVRTVLTYRHGVVTRLTHWLNAVCLGVLLLSGLQIFNAYPTLQWGKLGADTDPFLARIESSNVGDKPRGAFRIGHHAISTTGLLGASKQNGEWTSRAFPAWMTLPSGQDLATGRRWHFFFAWMFVFNGMLYGSVSLLRGHLKRDLLPKPKELRPYHLWHEVVDHLRLRFPKGEAASHYNAIQKLSYLSVIVILLPLMVLTGLSMSPSVDAFAPVLLDLFGGRQSARTIHFVTSSLIVIFVLVHVLMVLLSGVWNNMRSMITGSYAIKVKEQTDDHFVSS